MLHVECHGAGLAKSFWEGGIWRSCCEVGSISRIVPREKSPGDRVLGCTVCTRLTLKLRGLGMGCAEKSAERQPLGYQTARLRGIGRCHRHSLC